MRPSVVRFSAAARPAIAICALAPALLLVLPARSARAQAWVPPAGAGSVTFAFQAIDNTGHRLDDGSLLPEGKSTNVALFIEGEYAFTDRLSVAAGIPYVFSKFRGPANPEALLLPVDSCRCWNSGWQDFGFTARYNLVNGAFALTPSVSYGVPSHAYDYQGEAVVGLRLQELRVALDAGTRLDAISPRLSMQGRYSFAFVEQILEVPHNRSNAALSGAFQFTRRLSMRGSLLWQHTHGGVRAGPDLPPPEIIGEHDRLMRDNNWRLGAGMSYSWSRLDVFASYIEYMSGTNTHAGRALTAGISWPFGIR
jgi:hypothetical protein